MSPAEIRATIIDILSDIATDSNLDQLQDEQPFRDQLELDSMDFLDIVLELRKRFMIQIPEEDYPKLTSMAGTVEYLQSRLAQTAGA
jgi:acyl carrier protein